MSKIDDRFLRSHPETDRWNERREKCEGCRFVIKSNGSMRCAAVPTRKVQRKGKSDYAFCIDARDGACGSGADLWEAA